MRVGRSGLPGLSHSQVGSVVSATTSVLPIVSPAKATIRVRIRRVGGEQVGVLRREATRRDHFELQGRSDHVGHRGDKPHRLLGVAPRNALALALRATPPRSRLPPSRFSVRASDAASCPSSVPSAAGARARAHPSHRIEGDDAHGELARDAA